ncbi:TetR-like C-terminal domain-containing protein [Nevskia soli]|uniref:TetR-like C-terminal domain-containing protein n=1 Tax=Nevskia soli TaxID=418856 RepID=UPI0004A72A4C|nr:TetR-like C-terminal domain-containing protein [Nevskia soli]
MPTASKKTSRRSPGRPLSADSERAIFTAVLRILSTEGYSDLTFDKVAAAAKASKATIYRRWGTKQNLVMAIFRQLPAVDLVDKGNLSADLIAMFHEFLKLMQHSPLKSVLPMLAAECVHRPELADALIVINEQRRVPMRLVFARAIQRGELPKGTDIELAIDMIQGAIAIRLYFLLDTLSEDWIEKLVHTVLQGFKVRGK